MNLQMTQTRETIILNCPLKVYSKSGCYTCWSCPGGKMGCDNLAGREFAKVKTVDCFCEQRKAEEI